MPFQAHLNVLTRDGRFEGWARPLQGSLPCQVSLFWNNECIGRAIADHFRRDLLEAKLGHGHYGFQARALVDLPPGGHNLTLKVEQNGTPVTLGEFHIEVPRIRHKKRFHKVEDLTAFPLSWTIDDVCRHIDVLNLELNLSVMGHRRFIEVSHMFAFNTWANPAAIPQIEQALLSGELSPGDLLIRMLTHDAKRLRTESLPSPYDARYPFVHP